MRYLATLFIISGLIFTTTLLAIVAAENIEPIDLDNSIFYEYSRQQANETEPQPVNLYFKGGDGGELKAEMPEGNATTEVPCVGSNTPRVLGTGVGTWTSSEIRSPITADARVTCSVWAKSEMSASNVYFHLWIRINGDNVADIWTNEQSLSTTPSEFTGEDSAGSEIQLNTGDTIEIEVIYFADPQYFIGPAPDSTMLVGGAEYDTHITITTSPITINVDEPVIENNFVIFSASYNDALSSSRLNARLMVLGDVDVITLSDPTFALGDNGSIVSWIWDHQR